MLGAIIVLMTSTINRVMVVELALPAVVPGLLVASHYAIQILRPAWGYWVGRRRTPDALDHRRNGRPRAWALLGQPSETALAASSRPLGLSFAGAFFLLLGSAPAAAGTSVSRCSRLTSSRADAPSPLPPFG